MPQWTYKLMSSLVRKIGLSDYRIRTLHICVGTLTLHIPKLREGIYFSQ